VARCRISKREKIVFPLFGEISSLFMSKFFFISEFGVLQFCKYFGCDIGGIMEILPDENVRMAE
jgi:hypothetical protein